MVNPIQFDQVSKLYRRGMIRSAWRYLLPGKGLRRMNNIDDEELERRGYFWALKDFSFNVKRGETVGLIGANGAGKTTALSILAGITDVTRGRVHIEGRLSALIMLGAGFHPEMTGHENIYLSGSILGLSRAEIDGRYEEIVSFAELEDFMDMPVKRYSSGMYARLGFSVAAHTFPDVLLVDEVLAVGDLAFRTKCYDHMRQLASENRAIVIVSHSMGMIHMLCDRVIWLDRGQIHQEGNPVDVISAYVAWAREKAISHSVRERTTGRGGSGVIRVQEVHFLDRDGQRVSSVQHGESLTIDLIWEAREPVNDATFWLHIRDVVSESVVSVLGSPVDQHIPLPSGIGRVRFELPEILLMPRKYRLDISVVAAENYLQVYDQIFENDYYFTVEPSEAFLAAGNVPWQNGWFTHPSRVSFSTALDKDGQDERDYAFQEIGNTDNAT